MKNLLFAAVLLFVNSVLWAQEDVSKILALANSKGNSLVNISFDFSNELGSRNLSGQALCIDDSGLFVTFAIEPWMKQENVKNVSLNLPGTGTENPLKAEFLWVDIETGLSLVRALAKGQWSAIQPGPKTLKVGDLVGSVGILEGDPANTTYVSAAYISAIIRVPEQLVLVSNGKLTGICSPVFNQAGEIVGLVGAQPFGRFEAATPGQPSMEMTVQCKL